MKLETYVAVVTTGGCAITVERWLNGFTDQAVLTMLATGLVLVAPWVVDARRRGNERG